MASGHKTLQDALNAVPKKDEEEKARQMIYSNVDVIIGGGHPFYNDNGRMRTPNYKCWSYNPSPYLPDENGAMLYAAVRNGLRERQRWRGNQGMNKE